MTKRLRTFLMLRVGEQWQVAESNDLDIVVNAWTHRSDRNATGILHIGFEQIRARHFDAAVKGFSGQLLLTAGAKYALPASCGSTHPVVSGKGGDLFLATHGGGCTGAEREAGPSAVAPPIRPQSDEWLNRFLTDAPLSGQALAAAGIVDDASYQTRENTLSREQRLEAGSYRFRFLCRNLEDPCEIAAAAPPWLRSRRFDLMMSLTARLASLFARLDIEVVSDLDRYSTAELRQTPHFGRKSVRDLAGTLRLALAAGPLDCDNTFPLAAVQKAGLIAAVRTSLLGLSERGRDIVTRCMGLDRPPETLGQIAQRHNLSSDHIRRIEVRTIEQWRAIALWDGLLIHKMHQFLADRDMPLPLRAVEAADPWFAGVSERPEVVRYLLAAVPEAGAALITIDDLVYIAGINQDRWQALVTEARKLLLGAAGQRLTEDRCRQLVDALVPDTAREFRDLLWAKATPSCHFVEGDAGERYLHQYGRGADRAIDAVLEESDVPLHYVEIALRASRRLGHEVEPELAHAAAARVGLLFAPGTYGLAKHLLLSAEEMEQLAERAEDIVSGAAPDRRWHAAEMLAALSEGLMAAVRVDPYILDIALGTSGVLHGHGAMIWSQPPQGDDAAQSRVRRDTIAVLHHAGRPLGTTEIRRRLLRSLGFDPRLQIRAGDPLIRVGPALWGLNDRDVRIKRREQPQFTAGLVALLQARSRGIHITELSGLVRLPAYMRPEAAFSLALLNPRLRVNHGQYLYLEDWGDPRRTSIAQALRKVLPADGATIGYEAIVATVTREIGRPCERTIFSALQAAGAKFDGHGGWRRGDPGRTCEGTGGEAQPRHPWNADC